MMMFQIRFFSRLCNLWRFTKISELLFFLIYVNDTWKNKFLLYVDDQYFFGCRQNESKLSWKLGQVNGWLTIIFHFILIYLINTILLFLFVFMLLSSFLSRKHDMREINGFWLDSKKTEVPVLTIILLVSQCS